jgi:hypothetical protein
MKKLFYSFIALALITSISKAQTTAMDFTKYDCDGVSHHLFSELDSGNVIIMEFIMTCSSCIVAGHAIETMMSDLELQYPGKVRLYQIAYTNSYTCATMQGFKSTNGFSSTVFDQGASLVAYYGGFGMPTVAIAAGSNHDVIYTNVGFGPGDTTQAGIAIRTFLTTLSSNELPTAVATFTAFPNPGNDFITIQMNLNVKASVKLQIVDLSGKLVEEYFSEDFGAGRMERRINISSIATGYYLIKGTVNGKDVFNKIKISR